MSRDRSILLLCYGNPARGDDGLGPSLAREIEALGWQGVTVESNYQLSVEDAIQISHHDDVLFVDAAVKGPEPFGFRTVKPGGHPSFTSHQIEPEFLMSLARDLFRAQTQGFALGIRGYEFGGFSEELSPRAQTNLAAAVEFLKSHIEEGDFAQAALSQQTAGSAAC